MSVNRVGFVEALRWPILVPEAPQRLNGRVEILSLLRISESLPTSAMSGVATDIGGIASSGTPSRGVGFATVDIVCRQPGWQNERQRYLYIFTEWLVCVMWGFVGTFYLAPVPIGK